MHSRKLHEDGCTASPALWKKSEVLIPGCFLGGGVVERKHWNSEATVAATGSGRHGRTGARSAELCGMQRSGGRVCGDRRSGGRGQRPEESPEETRRPSAVYSFTLFRTRYTFCKRPFYTCVVMGDFLPFILVLTTFLMSKGLTVYTSYKIMLWAVLSS